MRLPYLFLLILTAFLVRPVQAESHLYVGFGIGDRPAPRQGHYGYRYPVYRHYRPHHTVVVSPYVVAPAPYYGGYAYPVYVPTTPPPAPVQQFSGNYPQDLAGLHEKLSRLRSVVQRQNQKGSISQAQYDRFMNTLDGIEHDEHVRAFDRGGNLNTDDLTDLYRRLDQAGEDIEIALGQ